MKDRILTCGEKFVPIRVASKMLDKSVRTIRDWIHKGKIEAVKESSGYRWLIAVKEINRIIYQEKEFDAIFSEGK